MGLSSCFAFSLILLFRFPFPRPDSNVPGQTLAVEPRFAAVDVANIEEAAEGGIFRGTVVGGHKDVMLGRDGDGDGVV